MKEFLEDLEEVKEEEIEDHGPSKLKKAWLIVVSVFLVLLMVSFIFVTFPIGDIIQGKVESNLLRGDTISLDDFKIIFEDGTKDVLKSYYLAEQEVEISLCLEGYKEDDRHMTSFGNYFINNIYEPQTFESTYNHVSFEPYCLETVVILHTHPYKRCVASATDLDTLEKSKLNNEDVLMVVMCEPDRFSVYS